MMVHVTHMSATALCCASDVEKMSTTAASANATRVVVTKSNLRTAVRDWRTPTSRGAGASRRDINAIATASATAIGTFIQKIVRHRANNRMAAPYAGPITAPNSWRLL